MTSTNICQQLKGVSEKLTTIKASDSDGIEDVFRYLRDCETETMMLYDEITDEILRINNEEVTEEDFRQKMDFAIRKLVGN